tara:strand:+ start:431 stop:1489 length:1059 start_codon:yes stop_codon:yes gene_type:complete
MKKIYQDSTFYLVIFIVSYFIYVYPYEILNQLIFNEKASRGSSLYYTVIIGALVILYFRSKITFFPLKIFIYEGMGIGFISFWVLNIAYIISYFYLLNNYFLGILSLIIIILLTIIGLLTANFIKVKKIDIQSNKISKNYNFFLITDIHLGTNSINHLIKILKKIDKYKYDFILIGGDLLDSSTFDLNKLNVLKKIKKPIYFVTGNHEFYIADYQNKIINLEKFNIKVLNNKNYIMDDLNIIGIDDNIDNNNKISNINKLINKSKYNLSLIHKPSIWDNVKQNIDLMLSGHTHNGQIFPFNFFVRFQFKYKFGLYNYNSSNLYVSSGSGCWGPRIRLGTFNEIVYFNLNKYI